MTVRTQVLPYHALLGRNVEQDDRSLGYGAMGIPWSAIHSVKWERRIPILDQSHLHAQGIHLPNGEDSLGSCTGNEFTSWLALDNAFRVGLTQIVLLADHARASMNLDALYPEYQPGATVPVDERLAIQVYHSATIADGFDGDWKAPTWDDTGSSGLATTKVGKSQLGQVRSYRHAFTLRQLATSIMSTSVGLGTVWYDSMFEPESDGHIPVIESSGVAGGHQIPITQHDKERRRFWIDQEWGLPWGVDGRGYLTYDDIEVLRGQQADMIARVPVAA